MKIKEIAVEKLKPYWRNARIADATVEQLKLSIGQFGFNQPLVVDTELTIIAGHARLRAATEMGMKTVPCVVVELPPEKARAYRIADNKVGELSRWDEANLLLELRELEAAGDLQAFFPDRDLVEMLAASVGRAVKPVTEQQVGKMKEELDTQYETDRKPDLVRVTCPHCAQGLHVKRDDLDLLR